MSNSVRVRIAPSPTGYLHIGTAMAALFNWLFAKHESAGQFILRIEDTDLERSEKKFEDDIVEQLEWLGLKWDEFYKQSDRTKIYSKYIQKLLDDKKAFWCYHSEEELEKERKEQMAGKALPRHVCEHKRKDSTNTGHDKEGGVIRLAIDENSTRKIKFADIIRGEIEFEERLLGDISIAKDVDVPLYHFAVVVDDYEMDITHVIRGEDHIANTPKQILLQEALGFDQPLYAHLPLILGTDRSKLSKRHAATSIAEYRSMGYLPAALVNFLTLLGWTSNNPDREIMAGNELTEQFTLDKVHKSGAIFDIKKLNWVNSHYIKLESDDGLVSLVQPFVEKHFGKQNKEDIVKITPLLRERLEYLDQVKEFHFFFKEPEYEKELLIWKSASNDDVRQSLEQVKKIIEAIGTEDKSLLIEKLNAIYPGNRGLAYWPLRVALSGEKASPDPVDIASIIGAEKTLERIQKANLLLT